MVYSSVIPRLNGVHICKHFHVSTHRKNRLMRVASQLGISARNASVRVRRGSGIQSIAAIADNVCHLLSISNNSSPLSSPPPFPSLLLRCIHHELGDPTTLSRRLSVLGSSADRTRTFGLGS
jgi:hypothetical protein